MGYHAADDKDPDDTLALERAERAAAGAEDLAQSAGGRSDGTGDLLAGLTDELERRGHGHSAASSIARRFVTTWANTSGGEIPAALKTAAMAAAESRSPVIVAPGILAAAVGLLGAPANLRPGSETAELVAAAGTLDKRALDARRRPRRVDLYERAW